MYPQPRYKYRSNKSSPRGNYQETIEEGGGRGGGERQRSRWKTDQRLERFGFPEEAPRIRSREPKASPLEIVCGNGENVVLDVGPRQTRELWGKRRKKKEKRKKKKKLLNPIWFSGPLNGGFDIEQGYLPRSPFEKEPKHRQLWLLVCYPWIGRGQKRGGGKAEQEEGLFPTIHPST